MLFGGIEAGGTKMVCAVGNENGELIDRISIPTEDREITIPALLRYFRQYKIQSLGIGCFGPVDLNRKSETYGYITKTPKIGWEHFDVVGTFKRELGIPVGFDTDVNAAILGEVTWGAAKGLKNAIYVTIGTGIGVGVYMNGGLVHGLVHPEAGHILLSRHGNDRYHGKCPFHTNCFEGLAAGPAIEGRFGKKGFELTQRDDVWELEAYYIAQALTNYILTYSPEKIILWGGVMHQELLFDLVRTKTKEFLNGYVQSDMILNNIEEYIVAPGLSDDPGIKGAIKLAIDAVSL